MRRLLLLGLALAGCSSIQLGAPLGAPTAEAPSFPLGLLWERDADGAFGPSAARVTDRYVVVGTRNGEVVVIDRETGRVEGTGEFGDSVEGQLATSPDGETLYVPTAERRGGVEAYDVRRGRRQWRWRGGAVQAGVARVEETVVVGTLDGRVLGLDVATGDERWERPATDNAQIHAAPQPLGADVVVADDAGRVVRLDAATGAERWAVGVGGPVYAAPAVAGDAVYVSTTRGGVTRLDAATGAVVWQTQDDDPLRVTTVAPGPSLAVGFSDGSVRALDPATGAERWRVVGDGNVTGEPAWVGDRVVFGTLDKRLVVVDGATGREEWSTELRGRVKSALAVGGGLLVVLVEPRHVVAFHTAP
ncbi:PQQ-binding-like beta-propeller repeat protein [Rubrivirga sp.]|uniref:outer membrane protein assembly factor BamB family protein n=1 Tax=Rubrivirga sp. TaxID=1885344 RepID=UPI003B516EF3